MYKITGKIEVRPRSIVANVDNEIGRYYRSLVPRYYYIQPPKYHLHATVVRSGEVELITKTFSGTIDIYYSPVIYYKEPYFWLNCWSEEIAKIREELGLRKFRFPDQTSYHITIGNIKNESSTKINRNC